MMQHASQEQAELILYLLLGDGPAPGGAEGTESSVEKVCVPITGLPAGHGL